LLSRLEKSTRLFRVRNASGIDGGFWRLPLSLDVIKWISRETLEVPPEP